MYAFDADWGVVLWHQRLGSPQYSADVGCPHVEPEFGVNSTPVIDRPSGTLSQVAATEPSPKVFATQLFALDLGTGTSKLAPLSVAASAVQSDGSLISFDGSENMQRASLLLANN